MPLHKSSRGHRLDPKMISAPLGDFRHTMHIGRGGDVFGDTSFLSSHGPSPPNTNSTADTPVSTPSSISSDVRPTSNSESDLQPCELPLSESVSALSLDLDLDLGPSILGDVLGVMDGMGLGSMWTTSEERDHLKKGVAEDEELDQCDEESFVGVQNEENVKDGNVLRYMTDGKVPEESGFRLKGAALRPKVRFSDEKEEIINQKELGQELEQDVTLQGHEKGNCTTGNPDKRQEIEGQSTNHTVNSPPSPSSSLSSEYEGVTPLDRRREDKHVNDTDSEEEATGCKQGYTFEDEFDDEIGL